jgi:hypothetical protein
MGMFRTRWRSNFNKPFPRDPHGIGALWALEFEQSRPLLLPHVLVKLGVRVWTDLLQYRCDNPFKRLALSRSGHLALKADCLCELREGSSMPVCARSVDKLMRQHARHPHRVIQDRRDHDFDMTILAGSVWPALT